MEGYKLRGIASTLELYCAPPPEVDLDLPSMQYTQLTQIFKADLNYNILGINYVNWGDNQMNTVHLN